MGATIISCLMISYIIVGNPGVPSLEAWLAKELSLGSKVGFDPTLTSELTFKQYSQVSLCTLLRD